jgi:hypothetical protein
MMARGPMSMIAWQEEDKTRTAVSTPKNKNPAMM